MAFSQTTKNVSNRKNPHTPATKIFQIQTNLKVNGVRPEFDRALIASLPASGPRYTSCPTADRFH
ncbi:oxygen-independent coproporphyrinogen III oxidase, partial [Neisseria meningitidis]